MADQCIIQFLYKNWVSAVADPETVTFRIHKKRRKPKTETGDVKVYNDYFRSLWQWESVQTKSEGILAQYVPGYVGYKPIKEILDYINH